MCCARTSLGKSQRVDFKPSQRSRLNIYAHRWDVTSQYIYALALFVVFASVYSNTLSEVLDRDDNGSRLLLSAATFAFVVWTSRRQLARLPVMQSSYALICVSFLGILWLAGQFLFVKLISEVAVVAMLPVLVLASLGRSWLRTLAFPLFFTLIFVLPFGAVLAPGLAELTANVWVQDNGRARIRSQPWF